MRSTLIPLSIILLLFTIGCSGSGKEAPTQPPEPRVEVADFNNGHSVIGYQDLHIDVAAGEINAVPNRSVLPHYNVTWMLNDPLCPNSQCIYFFLTNVDLDENLLYVDIVLMNPTSLSPWDPRVIILTSEYPEDFDVRNADSWTSLFDDDDEFPEYINPFIALGKDEINRRRLPPYPYWIVEPLVLWINPDPDPDSVLRFMVEINWPGHCREPYEINRIDFYEATEDHDEYKGILRAVQSPVADDFTIACDALDWQENVVEVSFYAPDILGDEEWYALEPDPEYPPTRWMHTFEDISDVDEGHYETWFHAMSDDPTDQVDDIYQRFYFPVFHYDDTGTHGTPGQGKDPWFVFLRDNDGYADIIIKEIKPSGMEFDLLAGEPGWEDTEEFSPVLGHDDDGFPIVVFASDKGGQIDLWRVKIDYTVEPWNLDIKQLIDDEYADFSPCLHPDYPDNTGAEEFMDIVFYSYLDGDAELYTMDIDLADPSPTIRPLTDNWAEDIDPCFYKAGFGGPLYIAFASNRVAWDNYEIFVWQINPPGLEPYRITFDPDDDLHPTWSPVEEYVEIAFMTNRNGDYDIYKWIYTYEYDVTVPVFEEEGDQIDPCYSPNGMQILFAWNRDESYDLFTIPWDGNKEFVFRRTTNTRDEWAPHWLWK